MDSLRGTLTEITHPTPHAQPGKIVASCMNHLRIGGPGKDHRTNKLPPMGKLCERSKGERRCCYICLIDLVESFLLESILAEWRMPPEFTMKEWLARDHLEANPIPIKSETEPYGKAVLLGPFTLLPSTQVPLPPKSLALSVCVSPQTIHFWVWGKSLLSGRGPPSCSRFIIIIWAKWVQLKLGGWFGHPTIPDTQIPLCRLVWAKQKDLNETGKLILLLLWDLDLDQSHYY